MDTLLERFPASVSEFNLSEFQFKNRHILAYSNQSLVNGFEFDEIHVQDSINSQSKPPSESASASSLSTEEESDHYNPMLKYIGDMLMEEDLEGKTCMLQDCMALQAAEKSFYEVLVQNPPLPSPLQSLSSIDQNFHNLDENLAFNGSSASDSFESNWVSEFQFRSSCEQTPYVDHFDFGSKSLSLSSSGSSSDVVDGLLDTPLSKHFVEHLVGTAKENPNCVSHNESHKRRSCSTHHHRDDGNFEQREGRSNKQSALFTEVSDQMDLFDEVLLRNDGNNNSKLCAEGEGEGSQNRSSWKLQQNGQSKGSNGGKKTGGRKKGTKTEMIDLSGLLTQCAQAVASNDQRMATDLLKQIRQHSSPLGDGFQRLAHYFANGLEARLFGNHIHQHILFALRTPAADILKAYQVYVTACPFKQMSNFFSNQTIGKLTEKAARIHIIDIGILYGFQWPCLIQGLSGRPGGPPKLRITGVELPQPGFRPAERVEETGQRLAKYCERFNVPFEYNAIAKKWETVKLEELKIDRDEVTVVNCLYRLSNLPDDTTVLNSPRDAVLNLIKRINPDMFIHGVVNGTHNAPFFLSRFRETLFHFSALFDMLDATVPREDQERLLFEKETYGRDAMNIIACEGLDRVNRPETYKQWQARNLRAGFKQLPLDNDIFGKVRSKVKLGYHKEFVVDRDGEWMLQGWKGRILYGLSFWKPAF